MIWTRTLQTYLAIWTAVECARPFTWSVAIFHVHELLQAIALIALPLLFSMTAEEWVGEEQF